MLLNKFGFAYQGIVNNMVLFETAKRAGMDLSAFLSKVAPKALRAPNCPAYVINSIKKSLKERYNIDVDKPKIVLGEK